MKFKHRIFFRTEVIQNQIIGGAPRAPPCNVGLTGEIPEKKF